MISKLRVILVQLPVPNNPLTNTPLAAAYLKAYAYSQGLLNDVDIDILPRAIADHAGDALLVKTIVEYAPDLLGFSLYTWNSERSLNIALRLRSLLPDLKIVVGGPEVQHDNHWLCEHPAVDVAIIGEGERAFVDVLREMVSERETQRRDEASLKIETALHSMQCFGQNTAESCFGQDITETRFDPAEQSIPKPRILHGATIDDLSVLPSPYLLGYIEPVPGALLMLEVSRWCPYSCSFCLYGRNMGSKLGKRYFPLERLLAEIEYGRRHGMHQIHFIEANLNLVPLFHPLMQALAELNTDQQLRLYAELRGEHLSEEAVQTLARAGLRVAEVGLQSANPEALRAVQRRTDLSKWAAGTRRLYAHGVDVLLDVIIGLPMDDEAGIEATLDFIKREQLGPYDAFTLQVLPGTGLRQEAERYGLHYQQRPPYYVLATDRMDYATLRRLRQSLKQRAGLDPQAIEGCPLPRYLLGDQGSGVGGQATVMLRSEHDQDKISVHINHLATHVDILSSWEQLQANRTWLCDAIAANPSTIFDIYIACSGSIPNPQELLYWRETLPYQPAYLDRIAAYQLERPEPGHRRVSPRLFLLVPWTCEIEPILYAGSANLIWEYELAANEEPPLAAWQAAGGAGILVLGRSPEDVARWREQSGIQLWAKG